MASTNFNEVNKKFDQIAKHSLQKIILMIQESNDDLLIILTEFSKLILNNLTISAQFIPKLEISSIENEQQILNVLFRHYQNLFPGIMKKLEDIQFYFE